MSDETKVRERDEAAAEPRTDDPSRAEGTGEADGQAAADEERSPQELALESEVREVLRQVIDPEINIDVVTLGLIREVRMEPNLVEVRMILTTPFCPYAGTMVQQVKDTTRQVVPTDVKVTLLDEPQWSPDLMEGGDWSDWGLI